jgi:CHAT domain-containing protein
MQFSWKFLGPICISLILLAGMEWSAIAQMPTRSLPQATTDRKTEADRLFNQGKRYRSQKDYAKAISAFKQSLDLYRALNEQLRVAKLLVDLADAHDAAFSQLNQAYFKAKSRPVGEIIRNSLLKRDPKGDKAVPPPMGVEEHLDPAIEYLTESIKIAAEQNQPGLQGKALYSLGTVYGKHPTGEEQVRDSEYKEQAIAHFTKSLQIAEATKDQSGMSAALYGLAEAYMLYMDIYDIKRLADVMEKIGDLQLKNNDLRSAEITLRYALEYDELFRIYLGYGDSTRKGLMRDKDRIYLAERKTKKLQQLQYLLVRQSRTDEALEVTDPTQSLQTLVTNGRQDIGVRGRASISKVTVNGTIENNAPSQNNLRKLHQLLIEPIAQDLPTDPNQQVIFLPQGDLFLVPFAALPNAQGQALIERHTLSMAPSIQTLAFTQALAKRPKAQGDAVIVGDPTMPKVGESLLDALPGARQEAIDIAQLLTAQPLLGEQATKAAVLKQIQLAKLVHFATHGLLYAVPGDMPGAIALAPSGKDNGLLSSGEIFDLKLNADLVVLSACDTGRGNITGDGVVGLSRSFVAAGATTVVVSLWAVNDVSTRELMGEFYRQLKTQSNKAQALRQAMLETRKRHTNPVHWAAFTLIGDPN